MLVIVGNQNFVHWYVNCVYAYIRRKVLPVYFSYSRGMFFQNFGETRRCTVSGGNTGNACEKSASGPGKARLCLVSELRLALGGSLSLYWVVTMWFRRVCSVQACLCREGDLRWFIPHLGCIRGDMQVLGAVRVKLRWSRVRMLSYWFALRIDILWIICAVRVIRNSVKIILL